MRKPWLAVLAFCALPAGGTAANDYPTEARADYVIQCMARNGQTQDMLRRCSCSIDVIAARVSYERYLQAETTLRMRRVGGEKTAIFRDPPHVQVVIDDLTRAQAESSKRCF